MLGRKQIAYEEEKKKKNRSRAEQNVEDITTVGGASKRRITSLGENKYLANQIGRQVRRPNIALRW